MTVWKSVILETQQSETSHLQGAFSVSTRHYSSNAIWLLLDPAVQFSSGMTRQSAGPDESRQAPKQHESVGPRPCRERRNGSGLFHFFRLLRWTEVHAVLSRAPESTSLYKHS